MKTKITQWMREHSDQVALAVLLSVAMIVHIVTLNYIPFAGQSTMDGDGPCRVRIAQDWLAQLYAGQISFSNVHWIPGGLDWLPLHFYMMAAAKVLTGLPWIDATQWLHILVGTIGLIPFYLVVREFSSSRVAFVSGIFLTLTWNHVKYHVITVSEIPLLCLAFAALYFVLRYRSSPHWKWLALSACATICCGLLRYEGWVFGAIFPILFLGWKRLRVAILLTCLNLIPALFVFGFSYIYYGDPIWGLNVSTAQMMDNLKTGLIPTVYFDWVIGSYSSWMLILVGMGASYCAYKRKFLPLLGIGTFLLLLLIFKTMTKTLVPLPRYYLLTFAFFLPCLAYMLSELARNRWVYSFISLLVVIASINHLTLRWEWVRDKLLPPLFYETISVAHEKTAPEAKVLLDFNDPHALKGCVWPVATERIGVTWKHSKLVAPIPQESRAKFFFQLKNMGFHLIMTEKGGVIYDWIQIGNVNGNFLYGDLLFEKKEFLLLKLR